MIKKQAEIQVNTNADEAKTKIDNLSNSTDKLNNSNKNSTKSILDSNNAMSIADSLTGGLAGRVKSAADSSGLLATAQKALAVATGTGTSAMKIFQIALASTGIGAIIVAVGLLINYFKDFDPVVDKIEQGMAAFGAVIRVVQQALASLFFSSEDSSESFKNLGDKMAKAAQDAMKLKEAQQDLEEAMSIQDVANAKASQKYDELIVKSKNRNLSEKERIKLLQDAQKIEDENFKQRSKLAQEDMRIALEAARLKGDLNSQELKNLKAKGTAYAEYLKGIGKITQEEVDAIKKAELSKIDIEKENTSRKEKAINKENALAEKQEQEAEARRQKLEEKRRAAQDKIIAENQKNDEAYKSYLSKLNKELEDLEDDSEEKKFARKKARDLEEINSLKGKTEKELEILRQAYREKYRLLEQDIENRKNREYAETVAKNKADKAAQDDKNRTELQNIVDKYTVQKTYKDAQTEEEIDAVRRNNQRLLDIERIQEISRASLAGASAEQIQLIRDAYDKKNLENSQQAADAKVDLEKKKYELVNKITSQGMELASNLEKIGLLKGKAAQKVQKALTLAQIGADTASAISSLVKGSEATGAAAGPAYLPTKIATYAAGIIPIIANIAKAKQLLSSSGEGGGSGGGSNVGVGATVPTQPTVSFQNTAQTQISETIQNSSQQRNSQPVRAYVVGSDVSTAQSLERNIINGARF